MTVNPEKYKSYTRFIPSFYEPTRNTYVRALLLAWSEQDDYIVSQIYEANNQLFVETAEKNYLNALGANVGVFRPLTFNMTDATFRELIPILSYNPKQIRPTIQKVLDLFFGANNPDVGIYEIYNRNIIIRIPFMVPTLRRNLKGSGHMHDYDCQILEVHDAEDYIIVAFNHLITSNLFAGGKFGQGNHYFDILSNTSGQYGVKIQFGSDIDLSVLDVNKVCMCLHPKYIGSFIRDPGMSYTITKHRGILGQTILAGNVYAHVIMQDSADIPDTPGILVFDYGMEQEEAHIRYIGRPNNTSLLLNPTVPFTKNHYAGEAVNLISVPIWEYDRLGTDYAFYITGISAARVVAQELIRSIVATGVTITFIILGEE